MTISNYHLLALDRLDVAFADEGELEANALRALFLVYLDLLAYDRITLKIFLRSDIWRRIMQSGFREASHITRNLTIQWNRQALLTSLSDAFCATARYETIVGCRNPTTYMWA